MNHENSFPTSQGSALETAIHELRSLYPAGSGAGTFSWKEQSAREQRRLATWASDAGLLVSHRLAAWKLLCKTPDVGGEEHHVFSFADSGLVQKITRNGEFGLWIELAGDTIRQRPATPLEYLTRLDLANKIWHDDIQLVRVIREAPKLHFVTTQPIICGSAPDEKEIAACMRSFDFVSVPGTRGWYRRSDQLLALDAHSGNFVKTADGVVVPIDLPMGYPARELAVKIESALNQP